MREPELTAFRLQQLEAGASEAVATASTPGTMSAADKTKLDTYASTPGTNQGELQHLSVDIPLATIQAKTSGAAFDIGAALPTNAVLVSCEVSVIAAVTGGTIIACNCKVQNTGATAGEIMGSTDVFTATGRLSAAGSNPYRIRGGQQLQATLTATGDTLAHATTGHIAVDVFYAVVP